MRSLTINEVQEINGGLPILVYVAGVALVGVLAGGEVMEGYNEAVHMHEKDPMPTTETCSIDDPIGGG